MKIIDHLRGYEKQRVITIDRDGEVRATVMRIYRNGILAVWGRYTWREVRDDGTVAGDFIKSWRADNRSSLRAWVIPALIVAAICVALLAAHFAFRGPSPLIESLTH